MTVMSSSSGDDEDSSEANIASARQWTLLDVDNPPVKPPPFPFLAIPGKTFNLSSSDDLMEYIQQFLDDELVSLVVDETNCKAVEKLKRSPPSEHSRLKKWVPVTKEEMWVFLALLLLQGIARKPRQQWYWSKNKLLSTPVFGEVMSCHRFLLIMRMLHFVDNASITDLSSHPQPKLCKIWPFLERLLNYRSAYIPERDISIDESLMLFKGRLGWVQYIPLKRARFGLKFFLLCEESSGYVWDVLIYTAKGTYLGTPANLQPCSPMGTKVVMKLIEPLLGKGYCLTIDNFYTSPELVDLLIQHRTDVYGTVRPNRKDMPPDFQTKKLKKGEVQAYQRGKCIALQWRDKKSSLRHEHSAHCKHGDFKDSKGRDIAKSSIVRDYNHTMGGVDKSDQMLSDYPVPRKRQKIYYKKIFRHLIDEATFNSFVLYQKDGGKMSHLDYRLALIEAILTRYLDPSKKTKRGRPSDVLDAAVPSKHRPWNFRSRTLPSTMPRHTSQKPPPPAPTVYPGVPRHRDPVIFTGTDDTDVANWLTTYERDYIIRMLYHSGCQHSDADALLRSPLPDDNARCSVSELAVSSIDLHTIASKQRKDHWIA
ncbi:piggyBac transposable element-derived protein 4-like [Dermacentor silvarum]|uniref:piggyBac transposable element-derived protein 4-like n=1 Tax=Dermacentor silvarum TaxID=543639 RepID=UPI00189A59A7|nr:piggyBac transposable element-derived protein 4-like [Dermacentor silvarum]